MKSSNLHLTRLTRALWLTLGMFVVFAASFVLYVRAEKNIDRVNELRMLSFSLSQELRQSSDDLTRMVRTYVVTGDPRYRRQYQEILDIRDGRRPRPQLHHQVYWDLVMADNRRPRPMGQAEPLLQLMHKAGFTEEEFGLLRQAKANSDALTNTEFAAMALLERGGEADRARAILMLHDAGYHQAKARIMEPIYRFQQLVEQRTLAEVRTAEVQATRMRVAFILFGVLLLFLLGYSRRGLLAILGSSLGELHARIAQLGSGDFTTEIPVPEGRENSILGWLAETRRKLALAESERSQAQDRVHYLAHFDALTGLANRAHLDERARYAISLAQRNHASLALMFLDLDHFKDINDTLGHRVGDALLLELSRRLRLAVREEDTLARLGGDEFIFLLHGVDAASAAHVAEKLLDVIAQPCRVERHDLTITGSIGIALFPEDGGDLETLFRRADAAMYHAKRDGRQGYRFFTQEMQARSARHLQLVNALRHAVERDQLQLHFQPQVSVADGRLVGAEALLRWHHPELGAVSPAEFIPAAEESGLILPIGEWVLRHAVRQARLWLDQGLPPLVMAVNLSAVQFRHPDLPQLVSSILEEEGLPPEYLELELTEGVAMRDPLAAIAVMNDLHDRGVRMSIDDFGTGYSSLSQLKKFKVYKLKIDQSFVRDISTDPEDKAIVCAIINMARSLGLQTIAEGVETPGQRTFLQEQGCDELQGYLYSKPLPREQFEAFARNMPPPP